MTELQTRKKATKARWDAVLKEEGWTTDGCWWFNPRSGYRYPYATAVDLEKLRRCRLAL